MDRTEVHNAADLIRLMDENLVPQNVLKTPMGGFLSPQPAARRSGLAAEVNGYFLTAVAATENFQRTFNPQATLDYTLTSKTTNSQRLLTAMDRARTTARYR